MTNTPAKILLALVAASYAAVPLCAAAKVSFPDAPRQDDTSGTTQQDRPEARFLSAGSDGTFGLSDTTPTAPRNIAGMSVFGQSRRRPDCPLCDVSVYSYCGDRLLHDACCCLPPQQLPQQCELADCNFLHAKSCHEHRLITRCCCDFRLF